MYVHNYEDLIYGEDNESPIRKTLDRVLKQAKTDEQRLQIEVRSKQEGLPTSRQEHRFVIDPEQASTEGIMRVLVERLTESPAEGFYGELRINFAQAGSSGERYGSFTRTLRRPAHIGSGAPSPLPYRQRHGGGGDEEEEGDESYDEMDDPMIANQLGNMRVSESGPPVGFAPQSSTGIVDQRMAQQWLETSMGFTFRSMAQQQAMFERVIRMLESFSLRFGLPHPVEQGIVEQRGGGDNSPAATGMGMLPMLMQAAAHLANAGDTGEVTQRVGSMAQGHAPPPGAARQAAIRGASELVRQLPRVVNGAPNPTDYGPSEGGWAHEDTPHDPEDDGGGDGGAYFDEDDDEDHSNPDVMPDLTGMSPEEMKQTVIEWIRADPSRKKDVMAMLPDLQSELM